MDGDALQRERDANASLRSEVTRLQKEAAAARAKAEAAAKAVDSTPRLTKPADDGGAARELSLRAQAEARLAETEASLERALEAKAKSLAKAKEYGRTVSRLEHERDAAAERAESASRELAKAKADLASARSAAHETSARAAATAQRTTTTHTKQSSREREVCEAKLKEHDKARRSAEERARVAAAEAERLRVALAHAESRLRTASVARTPPPVSPVKSAAYQKLAGENQSLRRAVSHLEERLLRGAMIKIKQGGNRDLSLLEAHGIDCGCQFCVQRKAETADVGKSPGFKEAYTL